MISDEVLKYRNGLLIRERYAAKLRASSGFPLTGPTYNNERPNMALGGITPAMKLKQAA